MNFLDNFNKIKHKLKTSDIRDINNWDSYKKKTFTIGYKKKILKKPVSINSSWYNLMISNLIKIKKEDKKKFDFKKNFSLKNLINKFIKIDINKIPNIKRKIYFNKPKTIYFIIDLRRLKTIITASNYKKQILTMSNGLMFKKMNLNHKKYKKSIKLTFLIVKNTLVRLNFLKNFSLAYIYIKGVSQASNSIIDYFNKNVKKKNTKTNIVFLNSYKITNDKNFRIKRVKSIKRRLKKKFLKLN